MRVIGIDPGLAACGYGVIHVKKHKVRAVEFGCWQTASDERIEVRLCELYLAVSALVGAYRPDAVAVEESFVGRDPRVALSVGQVRGAILLACATAGVPCVECPPASVKQAVCNYGRAEKAQVQQMAKAILGLETTPTPTHAADALAVAICHALTPQLLRLAS